MKLTLVKLIRGKTNTGLLLYLIFTSYEMIHEFLLRVSPPEGRHPKPKSHGGTGTPRDSKLGIWIELYMKLKDKDSS